MLDDFGLPDSVIAEGDRNLGAIWRKVCEKRGISFRLVNAETWRTDMLFDREQRNSSTAKAAAIDAALEIIEDSDAPSPVVELTDDVAEAILIGRWYSTQ